MGQLAPNPFAVAATADVDFPQAKSKTPIVIAVVLGLLAVAGIVAVIATTSGSPPPVPAPAPSPAAPPAPVTQPTAAVTPTETATAAPTANTPPNSNGNPLAPPDASPRPSSGNFSDLFAQGVEKAGKGTPSSAQPFDADAAKRAVAAVLPQVAACKEGGSPVGQTAAAVTFDASGKVSGVTVGAPFAGTSTGTCMVTAFKQVRVAPFSGLPQTVSQVVSLR